MEEIRFKFDELQVFQKALKSIDDTYKLTKSFPKEKT